MARKILRSEAPQNDRRGKTAPPNDRRGKTAPPNDRRGKTAPPNDREGEKPRLRMTERGETAPQKDRGGSEKASQITEDREDPIHPNRKGEKMTTKTKTYDPDEELEALYAAISRRPAFSYDPGADPVYQSYARRYAQDGLLAMRDTMGQAAALTGGYGSSYSQSAGQQRYDEYLRSLGEVLPELYGMAYQQYADQGEALRRDYDLAFDRREAEYRRGLDRENRDYARRQDSYKKLYQLIASSGYSPSDTELSAAGLSRAQAESLRAEYLRKNDLLPKPAPAASGAYSGGGKKESAAGAARSKSVGGASRPVKTWRSL